MPDPRLETLAGVVGRVEGAACWLARQATRAAAAGAIAGLVLWWVVAGERVDEWWGTLASVLVAAAVLAPAAWLCNVRSALVDLVALPDTLGGVTMPRTARTAPSRPPSGASCVTTATSPVRGARWPSWWFPPSGSSPSPPSPLCRSWSSPPRSLPWWVVSSPRPGATPASRPPPRTPWPG